MGDYDVIKAVLNRIAEMRWMQIAIKPAKPFAFGLLESIPVFGLPGNPVSSLVSFEMIARPALRQMMGHRDLGRRQVAAVLAEPVVRRPDGKQHLIRVITEFALDGTCSVRPVKAQGSHQLAQTALADAIAVVPDGDGLPAGAELVVHLLVD
jgi:molybdopterin biosynthesis enzyme